MSRKMSRRKGRGSSRMGLEGRRRMKRAVHREEERGRRSVGVRKGGES